MSASIREQFLNRLRGYVAQSVADDKKVVIVGGIDTNLPHGIASDPRVVLFSSQGNPSKETIPANAGVVIYTRFCSHVDVQMLHKQALAKGIPSTQQVVQTGELRDVLAPLVATRDAVKHLSESGARKLTLDQLKTKPDPPKVAIKKRKGALQEFVAQHRKPSSSKAAEAERLFRLASASGLKTTVNSIKNCMYLLDLKDSGRSRTRVADAAPVAQPEPAQEKAQNQKQEHEPADLLELIDTALAAMQLVRERVVELAQERKTNVINIEDLANLVKGLQSRS